METTLKQQALMKITALPDGADFREILSALRALRPKKPRNRRRGAAAKPETKVSCFELMQPYIGIIEGPPDLSTNKAYLEGYGE